MAASARHRVVIVGGGFAGLNAARRLDDPRIELTLVDRRNFHLFQPLLYQVATGGLSPAEICAPLRAVLHRQEGTRVLLEEAVDVDVAGRRVVLERGSLPYDTLIVATGSSHHYFGHPEWAERAPGLKTVEDATTIRSRVLRAFEEAELAASDEERRRLLSFVLVGAGPTGVELAGTIGELARHTLRRDFRSYDPASARILLVEALDRVLPPFPEKLSAAARRDLERLGVEVLTGTTVEEIGPESVTLKRGEERWAEPAGAVLWAAGVQASPLARKLAERTGAETDQSGRLRVEGDCTLPGHPEILVLGDMALLDGPGGKPLPGLAPVAMQQGRYAAKLVRRRLAGRATPPFRYRDKGHLAVIGRAAAVADLGAWQFSGPVAWLLWLFIHIMYLVGFANRVLVLVQWAESYIARGRGARIITDPRQGPPGGGGVGLRPGE
jgi:NADH dehydrogenase